MRWFTLLSIWVACAVPVAAQEWQAMTKQLIETEKPGSFNACGVCVDHKTGDVYLNLSDKGIYRSTDQAKTWKRLAKDIVKGRTEWPGCIMLDPLGGKNMVMALVYGAPIAVSTDGTESWKFMDKKSSHVDWFAIDWSDPEMKWVLTLKHESGDLLLSSHDGGKSFTEIGKGYGPAWIFDNQTAVVAQAKSKTTPKPGLLRTTDGGKSFTPCGDYSVKALPKWRDGKLYWVTDNALIVSDDKGVSWKKLGDLKDGRFGPIFGKDAQHLFVLVSKGILESKDHGATWQPIALPPELKGVSNLTWLDYDPVHDNLYVMKMATDLYKWKR